MKKKIYFIFTLIILFYSTNVYAETDVFDFCNNPEPLQVLLFVKYFITIVKILVPLLLIFFGSVDLIKAIVANKPDDLNKSIFSIVKKVIAGIIIFFLPTLITIVLNLVNSDFSMCEENLTQEKINELKNKIIQEG